MSKRATDHHYLEGFAPEPTGTHHTVLLHYDEWEEAQQLIFEMDQLQRWGDHDELSQLRDLLQSKPWWPKGWQPGDHLNVRLTPRSQVLVQLGLSK